ncbi:sensor histidine kinase [Nocardioides sp. BGMRC 2183]|nr:sensor histidine kinase [Nocardioides sp. BGMRC 2183]
MTDFAAMEMMARVELPRPLPVTAAGLVERLRLTVLGLCYAASFLPSLLLAIFTLVCIPLTLALGMGVLVALVVVPATAALTAVHRRATSTLLEQPVDPGYRSTAGVAPLLRPFRWVGDPARWRDFGFLCFSATGGFVIALLPAALLTLPVTWLVLALTVGGFVWLLLLLLSGPVVIAWWFVTGPLVRARLLAERAVLGHARVADLIERVERVEVSRAASLDHSAAEVRRIERDLHDGAQARIASVGMSVGLAETLLRSDPERAAALLREARETTVDALDDLRTVVRGIHPPVLADRGLAGGIEALALALPVPVALAVEVPRLPPPIESAAYFAVAECLANTAKHADATRAWVTGSHDGHRLSLVVGDDGIGGADPAGGGLSGITRRLDAFDGDLTVHSPAGGPTVIRLEIPSPTAMIDP